MACRFYHTPGGCLRGRACVFRHDDGGANNVNGNDHNHSSTHYPTPPATNNHGYSHDNGGMPLYSPGNPYAHDTLDGTSGPCRFYMSETGCRNGQSCPFIHVDQPLPPPTPPFRGLPPPPPAMYGFPPPQMMMYHNSVHSDYIPEYGTLSPPLPPPLMTAMQDLDVGLKQQHHVRSPTAMTPMTPTRGISTPTTPSSTEKPRRKLDIQANPSKKSNYEVISEIMPVLSRDIEGPFFAIDVECVATGQGVDDRDVARIAIVNEDEDVVYDQYVLPSKPIVSYLTQLTGITESNLVNAPSLEEALVQLRAILPNDSVIVGQSIKKDLEWLGLEKGDDFRQMFDVADLFRIPMQSKNGTIRYRYFSLRHVAKYLLGHDIQENDHDPVIDAKYAMKIFRQFRHLHESPGHRDAVYQTLLQTPRTPSFAERFPVIDGVQMRIPRQPREPRDYRDGSGFPPPSPH